jgi:Cu/Ag efflux pump CusA
MFSWIIGERLRFRFLVLAIAASAAGVRRPATSQNADRRIPRVRAAQGEIQTEGPGMTSTQIEELITIPMEDQLRSIPGVEYVRSSSVVGLSWIVLLFKMGTDPVEARQRAQERLKLAIPGRRASAYQLNEAVSCARARCVTARNRSCVPAFSFGIELERSRR